jgi:16S rRNA (cytosine967-C5)-methyltransferase
VNTPASATARPRSVAALLVQGVSDRGESLGAALPRELRALDDPRQRALAQELAFGTLRWYLRLDAVLRLLLRQALRRKDRDIHALLLVGLYQLLILEMSPHAAVNETAEAARACGKPWAVALLNGVLRNAQRRADELLAVVERDPVARWSHPDWWVAQLREDWPQQWRQVLQAGNQRPPMVLRVNRRRADVRGYLRKLQVAGVCARPLACASSAVCLDSPLGVDQLPGFRDGLVSVQDAAAQQAVALLDLAAGQRVLDACAAPGGKTGHILETEAALAELIAIDADKRRLDMIRDNLSRLQLEARLIVADAGQPAHWWDGEPFDRILLDAPCSASGVVRRHPDIKLLRRRDDLGPLSRQQRSLLDALWPLLAPGGILLYVTCSVFRQENSEAVHAFMARHADAKELPLDLPWGLAQPVGRQILPGEQGMDGFYFARLTKIAAASP